ncbi:MAG TPA: hypothetical protein VMA37_01505 [Acetobacteraceae bacterium]|nr:hypothetical protein [Acetobacteraceae bacterium]
MSDDVSIIIGGQAISGWQGISVKRGAERVPSSFDLSATERYPGQISSVAIAAGSACQVKIGADLVLTGYVDRVLASLSDGSHAIRVQGRSKVEDVVDCSVTNHNIAGMQQQVSDLVAFAGAICAPFGIKVVSLAGATIPVALPDGGGPIPINVMLGETGYDVIERVARYVQVLVYDDPNGNLVLATGGGGGTMASGFQQGVNIQSASGALSMDQRFSTYLPAILSYQQFGDLGAGGAQLPPVLDPTVPRYRPLYVISEQVTRDQALAVRRAKWEMARRYGRSQAITVVCDSWRDRAGTLWQPNAFAQINMPALKIAPIDPWVISDVTYSRDARSGTTASLTVMPRQAFTQEPIILVPFGWYDHGQNAPAAGAAGGGP